MNGVMLHRTKWLSEGNSKAAVVLVHGQGEHSGRYAYAAKALNAQGFDVFSGDLPGHGRSGGRRGHIRRFEEYLAALAAWIEEAQEHAAGRPLFLFGHSFGGLIAARYAQTAADASRLAGLVLSSPAFRIKFPIPRWKQNMGLYLDHLLPMLRLPSGLDQQRATRNEEIARAAAQDPLMVYKVSVRFYNEMLRAQAAALAEAGRIRLPLLLLHGADDEIIAPEESLVFGQRVSSPDKEVRLLPGLHHEIINEPERDDVLREITGWMDARLHP